MQVEGGTLNGENARECVKKDGRWREEERMRKEKGRKRLCSLGGAEGNQIFSSGFYN